MHDDAPQRSEVREPKLITKCREEMISNGKCNRTELSPIRSVIIRLMTKSDDRTAGVRFVYH